MSPILKPIFEKPKLDNGGIKSLPSLTRDSLIPHLAPVEEYRESLEIEGRLLMLPLLNWENSNWENKQYHDREFHGVNESAIYGIAIWPICPCYFAKRVRELDLQIRDWSEYLK